MGEDAAMSSTIDRRKNNVQPFKRTLRGFGHPDPSRRIASVRAVATAQTRTEEERARAVAGLLYLLHDGSTGSYLYSGFMCDEEEPAVRVCNEAALALVLSFGYADTVAAAFNKARAAGYPVATSVGRS
jgi:hypothetical protein